MVARRQERQPRKAPQHGSLTVVLLAALSTLTASTDGCLVQERCFSQADCEADQICSLDGTCALECTQDSQCGAALVCHEHRCVTAARGTIVCPPDMVNVANAFCVDRYEASRADASESFSGVLNGVATSREGVLPWQVTDNAAANTACVAARKTLCTAHQWRVACEGSEATTYGYGNDYNPKACNGIDLFGSSQIRLLPTGSLPKCVSDFGAYDMNGNLWEHVLGGNDATIRGGAYNCIDSRSLHRCSYVPGTWTPSARGFRCCLIPQQPGMDGGADASHDNGLADASWDSSSESGCIIEDALITQDALPTGDVSTFPKPDGSLDATGEDASHDASFQDASDRCPADMVWTGSVCMDRFEASHADATATSMGISMTAVSQPGILPWLSVNLPGARAACIAAGKRLCKLDEWVQGCHGTQRTVYSYGNVYEAALCNGIDTFCDCSSPSCSGLAKCPYAHCFDRMSPEGRGPCGGGFHVAPTGAFPLCKSSSGAFDVTGNAWELTDTDDGLEHFRGGAYNCGDSEALHRCDHDGIWGPSARGFRCCKDATP